MAIETIHGEEIEIKDDYSDSIKEVVRAWEKHPEDFRGDLKQVDKDSQHKIYIGEKVVFERKNGQYILRKSSKFS